MTSSFTDAVLQINLLDPPQTTWRGDPLDLKRRQAQALLVHMAHAADFGELSRAAPVPREPFA